MTPTELQKLASRRNWGLAQIRSAVANLNGVCNHWGITPLIDYDHMGAGLEAQLNEAWVNERAQLQEAQENDSGT